MSPVTGWDDHCPFIIRADDPTLRGEVISVLVSISTCFCFDGDTRQVHTTERGLTALREHFAPRGITL